MKSPWALPRSSFALVAVSTALFLLMSLALAVVGSTHLARSDFAAFSAIRNVELFPDEAATVRARPVWVSAQSRTVVALVAEPLSSGAPAPFGLPQWPEPGQFVVSPDLADSSATLSARFGEYAGVLPERGLPSAQARTILVRPLEPLGDEWRASGFGVIGPNQSVAIQASGFFLDELSLGAGFGGVLLAGVLPALILLMTSLHLAGRRNEDLVRTLEVLGTEPDRLHRAAFSGQVRAVAAGLGVSLMVVLVALLVDIPVPFAQFTVRALDVQRHPTLWLGVWLAGAVAALLAALAASRPKRLAQHNRPQAERRSRWRPWLAGLGVVIIALTSQMAMSEAALSVATGADNGAVLWVIGGSVLAACFMPAIVSQVMSGVAKATVARSRRRGSATGLLLGRGLEHAPRATSVAASGAVLIVIVGLASTWALMGSIPALQAQRVIDQIDGQFVIAKPPAKGSLEDQGTLASLPPNHDVLTLAVESHTSPDGRVDFTTFLHGDDDALRHWGLETDAKVNASQLPGMLSATISSGESTPVSIVQGGPTETDVDRRLSYIVFASDGTQVDRELVQRTLSATGGPGWNVTLGGEDWIIGANDLAHRFRWISWFAVVGGSLLVAAIWLRTIEDQRHRILTGLPIDALFAPKPQLPRLLALRVGVTILITMVVGGGTAALFARTASGSLTTTGGSLPVVGAIVVSVAVVLGLLSIPTIMALRNAIREWTPGGTSV